MILPVEIICKNLYCDGFRISDHCISTKTISPFEHKLITYKFHLLLLEQTSKPLMGDIEVDLSPLFEKYDIDPNKQKAFFYLDAVDDKGKTLPSFYSHLFMDNFLKDSSYLPTKFVSKIDELLNVQVKEKLANPAYKKDLDILTHKIAFAMIELMEDSSKATKCKKKDFYDKQLNKMQCPIVKKLSEIIIADFYRYYLIDKKIISECAEESCSNFFPYRKNKKYCCEKCRKKRENREYYINSLIKDLP